MKKNEKKIDLKKKLWFYETHKAKQSNQHKPKPKLNHFNKRQ